MEDGSIEGRADRVLRRMLTEGNIEDAIELIGTMLGNNGHDISVAFRVGLMAQGYEQMAMRVGEAKLYLHKHGFMLQIDPRVNDDPDWFENRTPEQMKAFDVALVWVLRGGNIDAFIDDQGRIDQRGKITPQSNEDVEAIVGQFKQQIDEQFPDPPPTRQGKWW